VPRSQYHPKPEERDERVKLDLPPDKAIRLVMETGPHPETEANDSADSTEADEGPRSRDRR